MTTAGPESPGPPGEDDRTAIVALDADQAAGLSRSFGALVVGLPEFHMSRRVPCVVSGDAAAAMIRTVMGGDDPVGVTVSQRTRDLRTFRYDLEIEQSVGDGTTHRELRYVFEEAGPTLEKLAHEGYDEVSARLETSELAEQTSVIDLLYGQLVVRLDPMIAALDLSEGLAAERSEITRLNSEVGIARMEYDTAMGVSLPDVLEAEEAAMGLAPPVTEEDPNTTAQQKVQLLQRWRELHAGYEARYRAFLERLLEDPRIVRDEMLEVLARTVLDLGRQRDVNDALLDQTLAMPEDYGTAEWMVERNVITDTAAEVNAVTVILGGLSRRP